MSARNVFWLQSVFYSCGQLCETDEDCHSHPFVFCDRCIGPGEGLNAIDGLNKRCSTSFWVNPCQGSVNATVSACFPGDLLITQEWIDKLFPVYQSPLQNEANQTEPIQRAVKLDVSE